MVYQIMPEPMSLGFSGGPTFSTNKIRLKSGGERRLKNRDRALWVYQFSYDNQLEATVVALRSFFIERRGDFDPFLLKDWMDFEAEDQLLGLGTAGGLDQFQCRKVYGSTAPYARTIRHLKTGTLVVTVDGVEVDEEDYTEVDGLITLDTPPDEGDEVRASFEFYVLVRFEGDVFEESLPNRVLTARSVNDLTLVEVMEE